MMDDDAALLALAAGTPSERTTAKYVLAERYHAPLMKALELTMDPEAAGEAATEAMIRLFKKASLSLGAVTTKDDGVWRWLLKVGKDARRDYLRWVRRRQGHGGDDPPADAADDGLDGRCSDDPAELAHARADGQRALEFIFELKQPERGILLHDLQAQYEDLTGEALDLHDEELIDCSKAHGIWTRDALRAARARIRVPLQEYLRRAQR